jgi:GNAT superfamily N-acetyltransferase
VVALARARLVEPPDVASVDALCAAAVAEVRSLRGGAQYPLQPLPAPGDRARPMWVGELAGAVVGYLSASRTGAVGTIDAIFVDPGCRSVGVGSALLDEALAWMAGEGCTGVDAYALPGARHTKNFFEEAGLTARLLVVHRPL